MPKKTKIKLNTKEEKEKIKEKPALTQEEINNSEKAIEEDEKINLSELTEFLNEQDIERISPSLKKINAPQRSPVRLERNIFEEPVANLNNNLREEENGLKYLPTGGAGEGPKYLKYEVMTVENIVPQREFQKISREKPFERKEVRFESSQQARISVQENFEKYSPVAKVDREKIGKEKSFDRLEKKEIKYTPERY